MTVRDLVRATEALQAAYQPDSEYGISEEDAAQGVIEVLKALGIAVPHVTAKKVGKLVSNRREAEWAKRHRRWLQSLTPEAREQYEKRHTGSVNTRVLFQAQSKVLERAFNHG